MPRRFIKVLLIVEAAICFGPVGLVLCLGVLAVPLWASMFFAYALGAVEPHDPEGLLPWTLIWPVTVVLLGLVGLAGLLRVLSVLLSDRIPPQGRGLTISCILAGIASLCIFNVMSGGIDPSEALVGALIYTILPSVGAVHFLYLARRWLFPSLGRSQE